MSSSCPPNWPSGKSQEYLLTFPNFIKTLERFILSHMCELFGRIWFDPPSYICFLFCCCWTQILENLRKYLIYSIFFWASKDTSFAFLSGQKVINFFFIFTNPQNQKMWKTKKKLSKRFYHLYEMSLLSPFFLSLLVDICSHIILASYRQCSLAHT